MKSQTSLQEEITKLVAQCKGDKNVLYQKMTYGAQLPQSQKTKLLDKLELIKDGDKQQIEKFVQAVQYTGNIQKDIIEDVNPMLQAQQIDQGVTDIWTYWWGFDFYISHNLLSSITDVGTLLAAVAGIGALAFTILAPLAPVIALQLAILKLVDQGKGVILRRYAYIGPVIPFPQ